MSANDHIEYTPIDPDTGFALSPEFVAEIMDVIARGDRNTARQLVYPLAAPDQAELFDQLGHDERQWLADVLSAEFDAETLAELSPEAVEDVIEALGPVKSAEVIAGMDTDDAIHILEDMSHAHQQELLDVMPAATRAELSESLTFPEDSAGRMMRRALVAVPEFWTVGDTIDFLRGEDELPEFFYVIYTVDNDFRPTGRVLLSNILGNRREVELSALRNTTTHAVSVLTDQEEVAFLFRKYALVEAPVVDDEGVLVGTITVDDVVDVMAEEDEEDFLRAGGISALDFRARLFETVRTRFWWLFVNLLTALLASWVISEFQPALQKFVALAVVMPMVASMGGNTGIQSSTVAVRAIAIKYLTEGNRWNFVMREALLGFINGIGIGVIMALGTYLWFKSADMSVILLAASVITMTFAGLFGALIPIWLQKLKVDPAITSGVFITTVTDCTGFFCFLGLATWILL